MVLDKNCPVSPVDWEDLIEFLGAGDGTQFGGRCRHECTYVIYTDGTYYYAESGITGKIVYGGPNNEGVPAVSGTDAAAVIQATINALIGIGGKIKIKGQYNTIYPIGTMITIPATIYPSDIVIEGDGWKNTHLQWNPALVGTYMFDANGTVAATGHLLTFRDIRLSGGDAGTQQVTALRLRRTLATVVNYLHMDNVFISYCASPAFYGDYLQDAFLFNTKITNNAGWDIDTVNASHLSIHGGYVQKQRLSETLLRSFGVSREHVDIVDNQPYETLLSGDAFDPVPVGYGSHIKIGTTALARNVVIDGCSFIGYPEVGSYYIDVERGIDIDIRLNHYLTGWAATYINLQDEAEHCSVTIPTRWHHGYVADAGLSNFVYTQGKIQPWISRIFDDFYSPNIDNTWNTTGVVAMGVSEIGGACDCTTGAVIGNTSSVDTAPRAPMITSKCPVIEGVMKITNNTTYAMEVRLYQGANDEIRLRLDTGVGLGGNAYNQVGGVPTSTDFVHVHDTEYHTLRIEVCATRIKFFVDEILVATHTTNIPPGQFIPGTFVTTRVGAPRVMYLDKLDAWQQR